MLREKLDELTLILQDLRMAMDIRDEIEAGEERGLIDFADGTKISVPIPDGIKAQLDSKIISLEALLTAELGKLKEK